MLRDLFSLFPAYAGVIPMAQKYFHEPEAFPRIRGGDPKTKRINIQSKPFSPHTRG